METDKLSDAAVVAVPFPAQSHLNQLLLLSIHIASYVGGGGGVSVHFACSAAHSRQAIQRLNVHATNLLNTVRIYFHDLQLPPFSNPPANPNAATKFPSHLQPLFESTLQLEAPISALLRRLSAEHRRVVVVHDPLMSAVSDAGDLPNVEFYRFQSLSAFYRLSFLLEHRDGEAPLPEKYSWLSTRFDDTITSEFMDFIFRQNYTKEGSAADGGALFNTSRVIEGEFVDMLEGAPSFSGKKLFAIGPINSVSKVENHAAEGHHRCLRWLDEQPPASVVYVAFGSTCTLSQEEIENLARGLKQSKQRFIWVLKDADRGNVFDDDDDKFEAKKKKRLLPEFDEEVEGMGMVVREWAPQLEILAHQSTAAFISHCGWTSCMESLAMGVPVIAWPMHSDQPMNALFLTQHLKVGALVREWDRRAETVSSERISEVIRIVMVEEEGKEMRERAAEVGVGLRRAVADGGSSKREFEDFVRHVMR